MYRGRTAEERHALVNKVIAMHDAGYSNIEIANQIGFSENSVRILVEGRRKNMA